MIQILPIPVQKRNKWRHQISPKSLHSLNLTGNGWKTITSDTFLLKHQVTESITRCQYMTEFCRWNNLKTCAHLLLLRNKPAPRVRHVDRVAWARRRRGRQTRIYVQKMTRQHAVLCLQILIDCFRSKTTKKYTRQENSKTLITAS